MEEELVDWLFDESYGSPNNIGINVTPESCHFTGNDSTWDDRNGSIIWDDEE